MKATIDNFSTASADYASFRPQSPQAIFDFLFAHTPAFDTAWDCGTGNGQVAARLAERFNTVYGTDISAAQLAHAAAKDNIIYRTERAEQTTLADNSIDLLTVAQAIHWFDFDSFYKEVRRVCRPGALIAVWTYSLLRSTPELNAVIDHLYMDITYKYWDKERRYVDEEYKTILFPFEEIAQPEINIVKQMTLPQVAGFLRTWSGTKHYIAQKQEDPIALVMPQLEAAWGSNETLQIIWPVHMRAGIVG